MATSKTRQSASASSSKTRGAFSPASMTWDDATMQWQNATFTWEEAGNPFKPRKNSSLNSSKTRQ